MVYTTFFWSGTKCFLGMYKARYKMKWNRSWWKQDFDKQSINGRQAQWQAALAIQREMRNDWKIISKTDLRSLSTVAISANSNLRTRVDGLAIEFVEKNPKINKKRGAGEMFTFCSDDYGHGTSGRLFCCKRFVSCFPSRKCHYSSVNSSKKNMKRKLKLARLGRPTSRIMSALTTLND